MMTYKQCVIGLLVIAWPCSLFAATVKPFTSSYSASIYGLHVGNITRSLKIANGHYQFVSDVKSTLPFTHVEIFAKSTGLWTANGPMPVDYHYRYDHFHHSKTINTHFDWSKHIAFTDEQGKKQQVAISAGDQDKLSYQLVMRDNLLNNKRPLVYHIADGHDIDTYSFGQTGTNVIQTPAGKLQTVKLQRSNNGPNSENIVFWLAPKNNYAIAKIVDVNNGKVQFSGILNHYQEA
mgnify:CR=1 FL=1|tara:strand:- start:143 stop:847 length:705 start_codon:yes stop_codon:yes gene_type:complete